MVASLEAGGVVAPERWTRSRDDANGAPGGTREEVVDPGEALGVRPLRVLQDDDERLSPSDAEGHVGEDEPKGVAGAAGVVELGQRQVGRQACKKLPGRV